VVSGAEGARRQGFRTAAALVLAGLAAAGWSAWLEARPGDFGMWDLGIVIVPGLWFLAVALAACVVGARRSLSAVGFWSLWCALAAAVWVAIAFLGSR
jgi:hypothetical protein